MVNIKKIGAAAAIGVVGLGVGGVGGAVFFPQTETVEVPVEVEVPYEVVVEVPYEVEVEVPVEVPVDNGNLGIVLDFVYEYDGDVEFLLDGLTDEEVDQVIDRIAFVNEGKDLALREVADRFDRLVHREYADNNVRIDDEEVRRLRFADDVGFRVLDFDYGDAEAFVEASFVQDDDEYLATFKVVFVDGEIDDSILLTIEER